MAKKQMAGIDILKCIGIGFLACIIWPVTGVFLVGWIITKVYKREW